MITYVVKRNIFAVVYFAKQPHSFFDKVVKPFKANIALTEAHGHRNAADDVRHAQGE